MEIIDDAPIGGFWGEPYSKISSFFLSFELPAHVFSLLFAGLVLQPGKSYSQAVDATFRISMVRSPHFPFLPFVRFLLMIPCDVSLGCSWHEPA